MYDYWCGTIVIPVTKALDDAKITYSDVEQACVGYVYGKSGYFEDTYVI